MPPPLKKRLKAGKRLKQQQQQQHRHGLASPADLLDDLVEGEESRFLHLGQHGSAPTTSSPDTTAFTYSRANGVLRLAPGARVAVTRRERNDQQNAHGEPCRDPCDKVNVKVTAGTLEIGNGYLLTPSSSPVTVPICAASLLASAAASSNATASSPELLTDTSRALTLRAISTPAVGQGTQTPLVLAPTVTVVQFETPTGHEVGVLDELDFQPTDDTQNDDAWMTQIETAVSDALAGRIVVAAAVGSKGTGKSTLLRRLTNALLSRGNVRRVLWLDLDVGQPELSPPGLVSLSAVDAAGTTLEDGPLLLRSPAHQRNPITCYAVGGPSPQHDPGAYAEAALQLAAEARRRLDDPHDAAGAVVINTHGWCTGLGQVLTQQALQASSPTHLFVMQDSGASAGDGGGDDEEEEEEEEEDEAPPVSSSSSSSALAAYWIGVHHASMPIRVTSLPAVVTTPSSCMPTASDRRTASWLRWCERVVIAHGGTMHGPPRLAGVALAAATPYAVPLSAVAILHDGEVSQEHLPGLLNASVVALQTSTAHGAPSLGLGLVRTSGDPLLILTAIPLSTARTSCRALLAGVRGLELPLSFLDSASCAYAASGNLSLQVSGSAGSAPQRARRNLQRRAQT